MNSTRLDFPWSVALTALLALLASSGPTPAQAASTIQFSATTYSVSENAGTVALTVKRTNEVDTVVGVDYASADGTATNGVKYTAVSGTISFKVGETTKEIVVPILNDAIIGSTTQFLMLLSNPTGGAVLGGRTNATVRITDNDKGLAFEFANYWAREDEGSVLIGVVRGDDGDFPVTVDVSTTDLSAKSGSDYGGTTNTLLFAAGEKVKLFTVAILNDGLKEPDKTFRITLGNPTGGAVLGSPRTATVTILDNDPGVQFVQNQLWVQEREGSVQMTVTRGNDLLLDPFTVDYATTNGTALAGTNYTETKGQLAFATGEMTRSFSVPILDDGVAKRDRQFRVILSNPTGGLTLADGARVIVNLMDTREMLPHRIQMLQIAPDATPTLRFDGGFTAGLGLLNRFQPFADIFPLEASQDLIQWTSLGWLTRTNGSTTPLEFADLDGRSMGERFYRTPSNYCITPNLTPTGPYAVGRDDRLVTDSTRRNRYMISTNGSFMVSIWYPAQRQAGQWPTSWDEEPIAHDSRWWGSWVDRLPSFRSHSILRAPFATNLFLCPLVLYSHGWQDYRNGGSDKAEDLASHGFVVVAVDHFDCTAMVFPDGRYLFMSSSITVGRERSAANLPSRVQDFVVVTRELEQWNLHDPMFAGKLDVQRVGAMGWSWGSEAAAEFCRIEPRCRAAVNFDEYDYSMPPGAQPKPTLTMNRSDNNDASIYNATLAESFWFQLSNTEHGSFGSWYFTLGGDLIKRHQAAATINALNLWFFNRHLKGSTDPMPALKDYPRVINFKQK